MFMRPIRPLAALFVGLSLPACVIQLDGDRLDGHCHGDRRRSERFDVDTPIRAVVIDNGVGGVAVRAHEGPGVVLDAELYGDRGGPEPELFVDDGVLHVRVHCEDQDCCGADLSVAAPPASDLAVELGVGDVDVTGLTGTVAVELEVGDIGLRGLGGIARIETGTGDVDAEALDSPDMWIGIGTGDAALSYAPGASPDRLAVEVGVGRVDLDLPTGPYDLRLEAGAGDVSRDGVLDDADADRMVHVSVGTGDIDVRGR